MELIGESEPTPVGVTSKNWYRMLLKTAKEVEHLIYWTTSPVENSALKTLPVVQQVQLFRVILEHWLHKCHPTPDEMEDTAKTKPYCFHPLGYDDKGDCYWQFDRRLYREELPMPPSPTASSETNGNALSLEDDANPRSPSTAGGRQKHKRERLAVTESAMFLRRTLMEPTTRPTRNSANRFATDLFLEEERKADRHARLRAASFETFESRTGIPLRWLHKTNHITTLATDRATVEAILFLLQAGTSDRMQQLVSSIKNELLSADLLQTPSIANSSSSAEQNTSLSNHNGSNDDNGDLHDQKTSNADACVAKSSDDLTAKESSADSGAPVLDTADNTVATASTTNSSEISPENTAENDDEASGKADSGGLDSMDVDKPHKSESTITSSSHANADADEDSSNDKGTSKADEETKESKNVSETENAPVKKEKEAAEEVEYVEKEKKKSSKHAAKGSRAAKKSAAAEKAEYEGQLSDSAEDDAISALLGASASDMSGTDAVGTNAGREDEVGKRDRTTSTSSTDSSMAVDAPRQRRQAAVKSRQMLSNGLHNGALDEFDMAGRGTDRKRGRNGPDELSIRIKVPLGARKMLRQEGEDDLVREEPVKKKPVGRPPNSSRNLEQYAHLSSSFKTSAAAPSSSAPLARNDHANHHSLANLEEEALSVLSTPGNALGALSAGANPLSALSPALAGIPLASAYGGFNQQMMGHMPALYGSPYLGFSALQGYPAGVDAMTLLSYNSLLNGGIPPQEILLQQQRQQLYHQQLLEAHFLQQQQQQFLLQQQQRALAQQQQGIADPTRITVTVAPAGIGSPTATTNGNATAAPGTSDDAKDASAALPSLFAMPSI